MDLYYLRQGVITRVGKLDGHRKKLREGGREGGREGVLSVKIRLGGEGGREGGKHSNVPSYPAPTASAWHPPPSLSVLALVLAT